MEAQENKENPKNEIKEGQKEKNEDIEKQKMI